MKGYVVFDTEAVIDPELAPALNERDQAEGKLPAVPFWKVVCIGAAHLGLDYQITKLGIVGKGFSEREQIHVKRLAEIVCCAVPRVGSVRHAGPDDWDDAVLVAERVKPRKPLTADVDPRLRGRAAVARKRAIHNHMRGQTSGDQGL